MKMKTLKDPRGNCNINTMEHTKEPLMAGAGAIKPHRRLQVQEFNNLISCYLCGGYLINPTTVDECVHSCEYREYIWIFTLGSSDGYNRVAQKTGAPAPLNSPL